MVIFLSHCATHHRRLSQVLGFLCGYARLGCAVYSRFGQKLVVGVVVSLVAGSGLTFASTATPANAEPHAYILECTNVSGVKFTVPAKTAIKKCGLDGYIRIYDSYDWSRVGTIDINKVVFKAKKVSLPKLIKACMDNIVCSVTLIGLADLISTIMDGGYPWMVNE